MECDVLLDKLQKQKSDRKGSFLPGVGRIIENLKSKKEKKDG